MRILATTVFVAILATSFPVGAEAKANGALNQNIKKEIKYQFNENTKQKTGDRKIDIAVARVGGKMTWEDNIVMAVYIPNVFEKKAKKSKAQSGDAPVDFPEGDFVINASAYTAAADECGKSDGITASGKKVTEGRTLACPRGYKFGTQIEIDGMGTYVCEDRGGAIKGNHFDIYMQTKKQAFAFGRRKLTARIVE